METTGEEITILKNSKPAFTIISTKKDRIKKQYNIGDFKKLQFSTGNKEDKNISKNINKLTYGI